MDVSRNEESNVSVTTSLFMALFEACDISHKNKYQSYFDYILNLRQI